MVTFYFNMFDVRNPSLAMLQPGLAVHIYTLY